MTRIILCMLTVLAIIYIVPFLVYSLFTVITDLKPPSNVSPARFLLSIFVSKTGTAFAFVLIFYVARNSFSGHLLLYAFAWWAMFVVGEFGNAIGPGYSWTEAMAGVISETIYLPLSAFITNWLIGMR
jgi:hypothetical protein